MAGNSLYADINELAEAFNVNAGDALTDYSWKDDGLNLDAQCDNEIYDIDDMNSFVDGVSDAEDIYDSAETLKIDNFLTSTCKCTLAEGEACSSKLERSYISNLRSEAFDLDKSQLDMVIMMSIRMSLNNSDTTTKGNTRSQSYSTFFIDGNRTCLTMFLFLHGIGKSRYYAIMRHYKDNGFVPREHGNKGKLPHNTLPLEDCKFFKSFMTNYAEDHAVLLPGRYPGYKDISVRLLPTGTTKTKVWETYSVCCTKAGAPCMSKTKFFKMWNEVTPYVAIMKPRTDLCWTCQSNTNMITRTVNAKEQDKLDALANQKTHLMEAEKERNFYRECCRLSQEELKRLDFELQVINNRKPCSFNGTMHYSFDYTQQLHYPTDPLQPGPIYFKTGRKCQLFGVVMEAVPRQINYLIDEAVTVGKGGNATVSLVHDFISKFGIGETKAHIHADNCSGQNKNRHFLHYFAWRVWHGLHEEITYSFMIAGHTKFLVDAHFGMVKKVTRRKFISSLYDIAECVDESSKNNVAELVGYETGEELIKRYKWGEFFETFFKPVDHVKSYQHFRFSKATPGIVYCKVMRRRGN